MSPPVKEVDVMPVYNPEATVDPCCMEVKVMELASVELELVSATSPSTIASMLLRTEAGSELRTMVNPTYVLFWHFHPFLV